jgi:hypothetical protein
MFNRLTRVDYIKIIITKRNPFNATDMGSYRCRIRVKPKPDPSPSFNYKVFIKSIMPQPISNTFEFSLNE